MSETDFVCSIYNSEDSDVLLAARMNLYISLVLVVIGLAGNFVTVLVTVKYVCRCSSIFYIFLLALSDSLYLVSVFLRDLLPVLRCFHFKSNEIDFVNHQNSWCKLLNCALHLSSHYSSVLIFCFLQ